MTSLLNLTAQAVDLATLPARFAVKTLLRFVRDDAPDSPQPQPPVAEAAAQAERKAPAAAPRPPKAKPRPKPPSRTQIAREQRITKPEQPPGGPGPEIQVAEPWEGYDAMTE